MMTQRARLCLTLLLMGSSCLFTAVAVAQSLALDYELTLKPQAPATLTVTNDPCDMKQLLSVPRCRSARAGHVSWNIRQNGVFSNAVPATSSDYPTVVREPRSDVLADDVSVLSKPRDVTLRLGSRYRLRYNTANSETQRFFDARYEAWADRNELNALGIELLFPFH
jgi:hypothetical protein